MSSLFKNTPGLVELIKLESEEKRARSALNELRKLQKQRELSQHPKAKARPEEHKLVHYKNAILSGSDSTYREMAILAALDNMDKATIGRLVDEMSGHVDKLSAKLEQARESRKVDQDGDQNETCSSLTLQQ